MPIHINMGIYPIVLLYFVLIQIKADIFISPDGYLSLGTNVKSIPVIHDINFMHFPKDFPLGVRNYYQYFFPRFAKKAKRIVTVSEFSKSDIIKQFGINKKNIDTVFNGSKEVYKPINTDEIHNTKKKYTQGEEYFLFVGALSPRKNIANLLSAFDLFKSKTPPKVTRRFLC